MNSMTTDRVCVCACVHIYACMYIYDVLVEIIGEERREASDWLRHQEGESTSLASDRIQWDRYVYKLAHL